MNVVNDDKATELPAEHHLELTKRRGGMEAALRRASVRALVDGMDFS